MTNHGMSPGEDPGRIVLLHSVSQFVNRRGRPATKWDSKAFASTGDVIAGTVPLANWEPTYLNLLRKPVNVLSSASIDTPLAAMPYPLLLAPLLLDPVADSDTGSTAVQVGHTVYVLPLFVTILLAGELRTVKSWWRLWGP